MNDNECCQSVSSKEGLGGAPPLPPAAREAIRQWQEVLTELHHHTDSHRITLRLDNQSYGWTVDDVLVEVRLPKVRSLQGERSLHQRDLATVCELARTKTVLVQPDVRVATVPPPETLIVVYQVQAQMLGPLVWEGHLLGWISVHNTERSHHWTTLEMGQLDDAISHVNAIANRLRLHDAAFSSKTTHLADNN